MIYMLENPSVLKHTVQRLLVNFWSYASITPAQLQNAPVSLKGSLVPISSHGFFLPPVLHNEQAAFSFFSIALPVPHGPGR